MSCGQPVRPGMQKIEPGITAQVQLKAEFLKNVFYEKIFWYFVQHE